MDLTLIDLLFLNFLAYVLAFIVVGLVAALPTAVLRSKGLKQIMTFKAIERSEDRALLELVALAAAIAVHRLKAKRSEVPRQTESEGRLKWSLRARMEMASLRMLETKKSKLRR